MTLVVLDSRSHGRRLTSEAFDDAAFDDTLRYELVLGTVIVTPFRSRADRAACDLLGFRLIEYLRSRNRNDTTIYSETVYCGDDRRVVDRVVWIGLNRRPRIGEPPTIAIDFLPSPAPTRPTRIDDIGRAGCREYWIIDRIAGTLTVIRYGEPQRTELLAKDALYTTPLLPGFELPLQEVFECASCWPEPGEFAN